MRVPLDSAGDGVGGPAPSTYTASWSSGRRPSQRRTSRIPFHWRATGSRSCARSCRGRRSGARSSSSRKTSTVTPLRAQR